jgi:hypothetical protein
MESKTEKIGNMKNMGKEWMAPGEETKVDVYDFGKTDPKKKGRILKAIPYGIYDVLKKQGFVNIGTDHNTAEFAVASLSAWWNTRYTLTLTRYSCSVTVVHQTAATTDSGSTACSSSPIRRD